MSDTDTPILPFDNLGIEPLDQAQIEQRSPDWYETWRGLIQHWVGTHADDQLADIVLLVPDLLVLLVRLARDRRVPFIVKAQLLLAAAYVLSPFDLVPEALLGVIGLADDAGVLALVLLWITKVASVDQQVLRDHWSGNRDVIDLIDTLHTKINANADRLFNEKVWNKLRNTFANGKKIHWQGLRRRK